MAADNPLFQPSPFIPATPFVIPAKAGIHTPVICPFNHLIGNLPLTRTIARSLSLPVILTLSLPKGKNPTLSAETPRSVQGDMKATFDYSLPLRGRVRPVLSLSKGWG